MAKPHEIYTYEYVNHPYAAVRDALKADPQRIFERATQSAAGRASSLAANLKVQIGSIEVGTNVTIEVHAVEEAEQTSAARGAVGRDPVMRVDLSWKAAQAAALFPAMQASLSVYPLSPEETQLELHGLYRPPLGALGSAIDTLALHRIADASVHRFVRDVAEYLRAQLSSG